MAFNKVPYAKKGMMFESRFKRQWKRFSLSLTLAASLLPGWKMMIIF